MPNDKNRPKKPIGKNSKITAKKTPKKENKQHNTRSNQKMDLIYPLDSEVKGFVNADFAKIKKSLSLGMKESDLIDVDPDRVSDPDLILIERLAGKAKSVPDSLSTEVDDDFIENDNDSDYYLENVIVDINQQDAEYELQHLLTNDEEGVIELFSTSIEDDNIIDTRLHTANLVLDKIKVLYGIKGLKVINNLSDQKMVLVYDKSDVAIFESIMSDQGVIDSAIHKDVTDRNQSKPRDKENGEGSKDKEKIQDDIHHPVNEDLENPSKNTSEEHFQNEGKSENDNIKEGKETEEAGKEKNKNSNLSIKDNKKLKHDSKSEKTSKKSKEKKIPKSDNNNTDIRFIIAKSLTSKNGKIKLLIPDNYLSNIKDYDAPKLLKKILKDMGSYLKYKLEINIDKAKYV